MSIHHPEEELEALIEKETRLPQCGSPNDTRGYKNMDWIRAALVALLKAERARMLEGSG